LKTIFSRVFAFNHANVYRLASILECVSFFAISIITMVIKDPRRTMEKSVQVIAENRNKRIKNGTFIMRPSRIIVPPTTHLNAAFFSRNMLIPDRDNERLARIIPRLQTTNIIKANARAASTE